MQVGDALLAINQLRLTASMPPEVAMRRLAGKEVYLTLRPAGQSDGSGGADGGKARGKARAKGGDGGGGGKGGKGGKGGGKGGGGKGGGKDGGAGGGGRGAASAADRSTRVRVGSTSLVRRGRYLDWVVGCRELVHARTGGKVGYVHVPDMEESGYAHFSRQFLAECHNARRVLLIDLRGNVGGVTSDVIVAKLTQRRVAIEQPPHGRSDSIPCHATPARLVVLVDENTCSDGELLGAELAAVAGALLVGSPSWGGVIGMGETELIDGTTVSHPSYTVRMDSGGALENRGLRPTVHVEAAPHDAMRGRDALLEAAIAQANELVAASERADAARGAVSDTEWMPIMRPNLHWSSTMLLPNA